MRRFIVVGKDEVSRYDDPDGWAEWVSEWDYPSFLIDAKRGVVIGHDRCEPEDATLDRHFNFVIDLLNDLATESRTDA